MNSVTIGRIIHFVCPETKNHRAAIVTEVTGETISLTAFRPKSAPRYRDLGSEYAMDDVRYCPDGTPGTWHWPEIVPAHETRLPSNTSDACAGQAQCSDHAGEPAAEHSSAEQSLSEQHSAASNEGMQHDITAGL